MNSEDFDSQDFDDELQRQLLDEVPAPGESFWDAVDARLAAVSTEPTTNNFDVPESGEAVSAGPGEEGVIDLSRSQDAAQQRSPKGAWLLAAAAALIVAGLVGFFTLSGDSQTSEVDVTNDTELPGDAEPPDNTAVPESTAVPDDTAAPESTAVPGTTGQEQAVQATSTTTALEPAPTTTQAPVDDTVAQGEPVVSATQLRCFSNGPVGERSGLLVEITGDDFVALSVSDFPPAEDERGAVARGTIDSSGESFVLQTEFPFFQSTQRTWVFGSDTVDTFSGINSIAEVDCAQWDDLAELSSELDQEIAALTALEQSLNIVEGDPDLVATLGTGIGLNRIRLTALPADGSGGWISVGDDVNNLATSGRTATVDGVGYTELSVPGFADRSRFLGWIRSDELTESLSLADIAAAGSGAAFGIIDEVVAREDPGGLYGVLIEGQFFAISSNVEIDNSATQTLDDLVNGRDLNPGSTVEFLLSPEVDGIASIVSLHTDALRSPAG